MGGWVDGWMDGWMDGWVGGWMDGWMGLTQLFLLSYKGREKPKQQRCYKENIILIFPFFSKPAQNSDRAVMFLC